jgi:predicted KAP-like P-loop ATPase
VENPVKTVEKKTFEMILAEKQTLIEQITNDAGELTPDIEAQLNSIELLEKDKMNAIVSVIDRLDSETERLKRIADFYYTLAKSAETLQERIKERVKCSMSKRDLNSLETECVRFTLGKTTSVSIENEHEVPDAYKIRKVTESFDTKKIAADIKSLIDVPGAKLQTGTKLTIRRK